MSRSPNKAPEEPLDLERLIIDTDYRQEVMLRLKAESLVRRGERQTSSASKLQSSRKD